MEHEKWKKIKTERVYDHKFFKVNRDTVVLPDGREIEWLYWDSSDSAMVIPITSDNKLVMIRQYRYLPDQIVLEFPSGHSDKDEKMEDCAKRELEEETGYDCTGVAKIGEFRETMSQLTRKIHIYIGHNANIKTNRMRSADPNEQIETLLVSLDDALKMVREKKIVSMGTSLAIFLAREYLEDKNA